MPSESPLADLLEEAFPSGWAADDTSPVERLRTCLARRDVEQRARIAREVHDLLGRGLCDMQMADVIAFELGCHLPPGDMEMTPSRWLAWLGRQVASL